MNNRFILRTFKELNAKEVYEILKARQDVFIVEQECIYKDIDDLDYGSYHLFAKDRDGRIEAYLRIFERREEPGVWQLGRVLTTKRGEGIGRTMLEEALRIVKEDFKGKEIYIEAQCYAEGYYEKFGFKATSDEFLEDGIPHKEMRVKLG